MSAPSNADLFVVVTDASGLRRRRNGQVSPLRLLLAEVAAAYPACRSPWYRLPVGQLPEQAALKRLRRAAPVGRSVVTATTADGVRLWSLAAPRSRP